MATKTLFGIPVMGIILGTFIAILFGVNEDLFKGYIKDSLNANVKIQSIEDPAARAKKIEQEKSKNWRYFQRFHFHSTGISSMALVLLLLLGFIREKKLKIKRIIGYTIAIGGFLYPFVWLFAGYFGPVIGRSHAKEKFVIFAYMGGVFLVGVIAQLWLLFKNGLNNKFEI